MVPEKVDVNEHSNAREEQGSKEVTNWFYLKQESCVLVSTNINDALQISN